MARFFNLIYPMARFFNLAIALVIASHLSADAFRKKVGSNVGNDVGPAIMDTTGDYRPICDKEIVTETCALLNANLAKGTEGMFEWIPFKLIGEILSASRQDLERLWKAFKLPVMPAGLSSMSEAGAKQALEALAKKYGVTIQRASGQNGFSLPCEEICYRARDYIEEKHFLPPSSDVGCWSVDDSAPNCDIDLRPATLATFHKAGDGPDLHEGDVNTLDVAVTANGSIGKVNKAEIQIPGTIERVVWQLVASVAELFRFYPLEGTGSQASLLQVESTNSTAWLAQSIQLGVKAIGYVNNVMRDIETPAAKEQLRHWFGNDGYATKSEVLRVMNGVKEVIKNAQYMYKGPVCGDSTFAYVYPHGHTCTQSELTTRPCKQTTADKYVIYLCDVYLNTDDGEKIETLVHEGSHHYSAYTDDVCADRYHVYGVTPMSTCAVKAYGRNVCQDLSTYDQRRALKNADNQCYWVQAVADPAYQEKEKCPESAGAVAPYRDNDGDCTCPELKPCQRHGSTGCPFSAGGSSVKWFKNTCSDCTCGPPASPPTSIAGKMCPASSSSPNGPPDSDGDCQCGYTTQCYEGSSLGCPWSAGSSSAKYFKVTCANCHCKTWPPSTPSTPSTPDTPSTTPTTTTTTSMKCPMEAFPEYTYADSDGDCQCGGPYGRVCRSGPGLRYYCPRSGLKYSVVYFLASCVDCNCVRNAAPALGPPPTSINDTTTVGPLDDGGSIASALSFLVVLAACAQTGFSML